jgi:predicted transcriptional regulator
MRRTTISLPDDLADALEREARRRSVSASSIARDALARYLNVGTAADRRVLAFAAVGRSGHRNTARDMEELLAAEWDEPTRDR